MKCAECRYNGNCKEKSERPDLCGCTSGIPIEKMGIRTNGDAIRAMTNEELAEDRITEFGICLKQKMWIGDFDGIADSKEEALRREKEWLESEVDNG